MVRIVERPLRIEPGVIRPLSGGQHPGDVIASLRFDRLGNQQTDNETTMQGAHEMP